jgi:DNA-binding transcriptional MerR regulator
MIATLTRRLRTAPMLSLEAFSRECGLHPDVTMRWVRLGLLEPKFDSQGHPWFVPGDVIRAGRVQRLRATLSVNLASVGLVMDLLDRIDTLEAALRRRPHPYGGADR